MVRTAPLAFLLLAGCQDSEPSAADLRNEIQAERVRINALEADVHRLRMVTDSEGKSVINEEPTQNN